MAKRKKQREERPPIIEQHNRITVADTGIFQSSSFATANWLDELDQLWLHGKAADRLAGRRRRLRAIIAGDSTAEQHQQIILVVSRKGIAKGESFPVIKTVGFAGQQAHCELARAEAATALKLLNRFLARRRTKSERKAFLAGCHLGELMMRAELMSIEAFALAGKKQQRSAANTSAGRTAQAAADRQRIKEEVRSLWNENPGLLITKVRDKYFKNNRPKGPSKKTIIAATKDLKPPAHR